MRSSLPGSLAWLVLLLAFPAVASASEFLGLDANTNLVCEPTDDMLFDATAGDVGTTKSIRVFIDDIPKGVFGHGCTFCVTDKEKIGNATFTYTSPTGWTNFTVFASDTGTFPIDISEFITDRYPNYKCWSISAYDFSFESPVPANTPYAVGTLQYQVADEGCIQWVLDGPFSAVQTTGFSTLYFEGPDETCDTVSCPSGPATCELPSPTLELPADAATCLACPVTLDWADVATAAGYRVQIGSSCGTGDEYDVVASSYSFACLPGQTYFWHVKTKCANGEFGQYGACRSFTAAPSPLGAPTLQTPSNGATCQGTSGTLDWSDVAGAAGYRVRIGTTCGTGTEYDVVASQYGFSGLAAGTTYFWQVKTKNACNTYGEYSACFSFTTVPAAPGVATLLSPADGASGLACPLPLDWSDVAGAIGYEVRVGASCGTGTVYATAISSYTFSCQQGLTYYWQVRARADCGVFGSWSPCRSFSTLAVPPPEINETTPACPIPDATLGEPYPSGVVFTATGGIPPYLWGQSGLPEGMNINTTTGEIYGTPTVSGGFAFLVTVEGGGVDERACSLFVREYGVDVTLVSPDTTWLIPPQTIYHDFEVRNTGNVTETFYLTPSSLLGMPVSIVGQTFVNLGPGQAATVEVQHQVLSVSCPLSGAYVFEQARLFATNVDKDAESAPVADVDTAFVGIGFVKGVDVSVLTNSVCGAPGTVHPVAYEVENTGECLDTFNLQASVDMPSWFVSLPGGPFVVLAGGASAEVTVNVSIPGGALCTETAEVALRAVGRVFNAANAATATECVQDVLDGMLSDEANRNGAPGDTVDYQFTLTNTGNCPAEYLVIFTALWGKTPEGVRETLDPGDTAIVDVGHIVPEGATEGDKDKLCAILEIVSDKGAKQDPIDESCVLTTVVVPCDAGVDVYGDTFLGGVPGDSLYADFFVENIGGDPDQYALTATCAQGWFVEIVGDPTTPVLNPGGIDNVEVLVVIPNGEPCGSIAMVELAAVSFCDPAVWDAHTVEISVDPLCGVSVVARTEDTTGTAGQTMDYLFRVTNEGNCTFDFGIEVFQTPDWDTLFGDSFKTLQPGQWYDFPVRLGIPADAETGDEHKFVVCVQCFGIGKGDPAPPVCDSTITRVLTGCVAEQPILSLGGYRTISYTPYGLWTVQVQVKNNGPGKARSIGAQMHDDLAWLLIADGNCSYPDLAPGASSYGIDTYTFDLRNYPGGSFNVWFDVTYTDTCGMQYQVRLDPTFLEPEENGLPGVTPARFVLHQNIPNPFNPETAISFELPSGAFSELVIYNTAGQVVKRLWAGSLPAGLHTFLWEGDSDQGSAVPSGTYFYSLRSGGLTDTKRMVLIR